MTRLPASPVDDGALSRGLQILGLWAFAVAQPMFDLISRHAEFLVVRRMGAAEILALAAGLALLAPLLLWGFVSTAGLLGRAAVQRAHLAVIALLSALILLPVAKKVPALPPALQVVCCAAAALCVAWFAGHDRGARRFMAMLGVGVLVFPSLFLFGPRVRQLVMHSKPPDMKRATAAAAKVPVVVVVFDELPLVSLLAADGSLDGVRYPNFLRLAGRSHWFRNAATVNSWTHFAVPAILTGTYPRFSESKLPTRADYPQNLFTLLEASHRIQRQEVLTNLCPEDLCGGEADLDAGGWTSLASDIGIIYLHIVIPDGLKGDLPDISTTWSDFAQRGTDKPRSGRRETYESFVEGITGDEARPLLFFAHFLLPHGPYEYLPDGTSYAGSFPRNVPGLVKGIVWGEDDWLVLQAHQRHVLQLAYADALLGRLLDRLASESLFDAALLVVTADHGASYQAGDRLRSLSQFNAGDILPVPLFVKLPNQAQGLVSDRRAEVIDIMPTVEAVLGIASGWRYDGRPLLAGGPDRQAHSFLSSHEGDFRAAQFHDLPAARDRALRRKISRVGSGGRFPLPFDPPAAIERGPPAGTSRQTFPAAGVRLLEGSSSSAVSWPRLLAGKLGSGVEIGSAARLVVLVDGTARGRALGFQVHGRQRFAAFVPATTLVRGDSRTEILALGNGGTSEEAAAGVRPQFAPLGDGAFQAAWRRARVPSQVRAGATFTIDLAITNEGEETWRAAVPLQKERAVRLSYAWLEREESQASFQPRAELPHDVPAGESFEVKMTIDAPEKPGTYFLKVDLVQERVAWFGSKGSPALVRRVQVVEAARP